MPLTAFRTRAARTRSMPVASMTAPNIRADMISHTTGSMLSIPPRESRSSSTVLPESSANPPYNAIHTPLSSSRACGRSLSPT